MFSLAVKHGLATYPTYMVEEENARQGFVDHRICECRWLGISSHGGVSNRPGRGHGVFTGTLRQLGSW
jgi:hypothetical protein